MTATTQQGAGAAGKSAAFGGSADDSIFGDSAVGDVKDSKNIANLCTYDCD